MKTPEELKIEALEKKLNALVNKTVFYKNQIIKIIGFKIFTKAVSVVTAETVLSFEMHLIDNFLEELSIEIPTTFQPTDVSSLIDEDEKPIKNKFQEISPEQLKRNDDMQNEKKTEQPQDKKENQIVASVAEPSTIEVSNYKPSEENVKVKAALMDMLAKVSLNPNIIPQAKAVCDIANTMVNIQKNEITMIQMLNRKTS